MPRTVAEWIGKTDDQRPPRSVYLRRFEARDGRCYCCGIKLRPGHWDLDHRKPLWDGGENRESNLEPACPVCHRDKSRKEAAQRAEGKRHRAKQAGIPRQPRSSFPTNRDGPLKKKISGEVIRR